MLRLCRYNIFYTSLVCLFSLPIFSNCKTQVVYQSPHGYDFKLPHKFILSEPLHEISGITFVEGKNDIIYSIEDETGKLFAFNTETEKLTHSKFAKKGDFEDLAVLNNNSIVVLRSDGSIFLFPVAEIGKEKTDSVIEYIKLLPAGEYEGLCGQDGKLFVLCKDCSGDKEKRDVSVYTLETTGDSGLKVAGSFKVDISIIQPKDGKPKVKFHPSGIAKNPVTQEWFIISSVNKLILVLDEQWKTKEYYPLDPSLFKQPEGITFNNKGDLYISNEGGDGAANILLFPYQKQ